MIRRRNTIIKQSTASNTARPEPPILNGAPILGNLPAFRKDMVEALFNAWKQTGDVFRIKIGPRVFWVINDPLLAQDVLITQKHIFQRPQNVKGGTPLTYLLGLSVLTVDGDLWLSKRRMMQPIFHKNRIQTMGNQMVTAGEQMLARWDAHPAGEPVLLGEEMKLVTLDIINRTMFSVDVLPEVERVGKSVDVGIHYIADRLNSLIPLPDSWPTPKNLHFKREKALLDEFLYRVIRERRASAEHSGDLLDMLLEARDEETGQGMSDEQVRNEVATIYGAGHETTAVTLTWTWLALNQHADVLTRLQEELERVLAGRTPGFADLPNLPYTLAVIEETLRFFPAVPLTVRMCYQDTQVGGYDFPKGTMTFVDIYNIHRHPDYWQEPMEFRPERFLPDNKAGLNRSAFMPFLTGPHLCIGNNFALMEGHLLLAMMAQRYVLKTDLTKPVERDVAVTMRPRGGLPVRLERRK